MNYKVSNFLLINIKFIIGIIALLLIGCSDSKNYEKPLWHNKFEKPLRHNIRPNPNMAYIFAKLSPQYFGNQMSAQVALDLKCSNPANSYRLGFYPYSEIYAIKAHPGKCRITEYSIIGKQSETQTRLLPESIFKEFELLPGKLHYLGDFRAELKLLSSVPSNKLRNETWRGSLIQFMGHRKNSVRVLLDKYINFDNLDIVTTFDEDTVTSTEDIDKIVFKEDDGEGPIITVGETIYIEGEAPDWCTDPGHVTIDMPSGTLDQCECDHGWTQVGSMANDQPLCGLDWGDNPPPNLPDPPPPGGGGGDTPPEPDPRACVFSRPENSYSGVCDQYPPDYKYQGASARCFCKCAGNSKWAKYVRGCLSCAYKSGVFAEEAHIMCYEAAAAQGMGVPADVVGQCALVCWQSNNFPLIKINDKFVDVF